MSARYFLTRKERKREEYSDRVLLKTFPSRAFPTAQSASATILRDYEGIWNICCMHKRWQRPYGNQICFFQPFRKQRSEGISELSSCSHCALFQRILITTCKQNFQFRFSLLVYDHVCALLVKLLVNFFGRAVALSEEAPAVLRTQLQVLSSVFLGPSKLLILIGSLDCYQYCLGRKPTGSFIYRLSQDIQVKYAFNSPLQDPVEVECLARPKRDRLTPFFVFYHYNYFWAKKIKICARNFA